MYTVRQARRLADKTQLEVANSMNIHVQTYMKFEKDPGKMSIEQAQRFAEVVGIPFNEIFLPLTQHNVVSTRANEASEETL